MNKQMPPLRRTLSSEEQAARIAELEARAAQTGPQQLFARIRPDSKYSGQTDAGEVFPVFVDASLPAHEYCVFGRGNQYRLDDVELLVVAGSKALRIN